MRRNRAGRGRGRPDRGAETGMALEQVRSADGLAAQPRSGGAGRPRTLERGARRAAGTRGMIEGALSVVRLRAMPGLPLRGVLIKVVAQESVEAAMRVLYRERFLKESLDG